MFENPRRGRQARNFTTNVPKILDLKSSSEQIFSRKLSLGAPGSLSGVNYLTFKKVEKKPFNVCRFYCPFLLSFLYICYRIPVKRLTENSRGIKQKQNLPSIKTVA